MMRSVSSWLLAGVVALSAAATQAADLAKTYEESVAKAIQFLSTSQADDGSYTAASGPGVTALVTTGLLRHGRAPQDPLVAKSLKYLEGFVQADGGIYKEGSSHKNYETCLAVLAFKEANKNGQYDKLLKNADKFIKGEQWDAEEGKKEADFEFGGAGYGGKKRPDLSNTQFFIDALQATGNDANSDAIKKALVFVSRCQNLETENNATPFAAKNPDGGFYYTPAAGGDSMAGKTDEGGLRSYASMTYAGLKSMLVAGLKADDPRVKAAQTWISKHYDLKSNPGMGEAGLYYYYHTFAKTLAAIGKDEVVDAEGKKHNWREDLITELAARQKPNGSWVNDANRWLEGDANIVTGYALLALSYAKPTK
jgi:squalene-hopene/tetraprenyl-beta-curcumene cyclase